jgi:hypothetical protein
MDGPHFDAWTRRRFGIAAGNAAAALLGLTPREDAVTKKAKKRCRKSGQTCKKGGKKRKCCGSLRCDTISFEPSTQTRCCGSLGKPCTDNRNCCGALCCATDGVCTDFCAQ